MAQCLSALLNLLQCWGYETFFSKSITALWPGDPISAPLPLGKLIFLPHFGHLSSRAVPYRIERMHVNVYTMQGRTSKIDTRLERDFGLFFFFNFLCETFRSLHIP